MTKFDWGVVLSLTGIGWLLVQLIILISGSRLPLDYPLTYLITCLAGGFCLGRGMGLLYFYKNK